uniref:Protein kinase domain-containing protein n=1 Tax=Brassica oleracea var. oleracea TaxID=109376 RepID=A0A0D3AYP3_BRAOL
MGSNKKRSSADSSENMESKKKKKPKMNADVTSSSLPELPLNYLTDLASPDASVREAAAASLVTRLQEIQQQYETLPDKETIDRGLMLEAEKNDGLDNCAPHLRYALRRVIRGVSSSRDRISVESLLKLVSDNLSVSSSMKGQDVKESLLGRLFAYGALARSGRLIEDWQTDKDSQIIKEFTNDLISLAAKKRYLQEPGVHVLLDFIEKLPIEAVVTHVVEALELHKWFEQATELLPVPFSSSMFFSEDHLSDIGNCFKKIAQNPRKPDKNEIRICCGRAQEKYDYEVVRKVGRGKYSEVFEGVNVNSKEKYLGELNAYLDKSQIKVDFLEEVFRRRAWIARKLFGFLVEKSLNPKVEFCRVEALQLISEGLRSLVTVSKESRRKMKSHMGKLSCLVKELVGNVPEKQARRAKVRKVCGRVFRMVSSLKLTKSFLKGLGQDGQRDCETALVICF